MPKQIDDRYSEAETERRREAALKRMLATPPRPHKASRKGKTNPKRDGAKRGTAQQFASLSSVRVSDYLSSPQGGHEKGAALDGNIA